MARVIRQARENSELRYPVTEEISVEKAQEESERLNKLFGERAIYTVEE